MKGLEFMAARRAFPLLKIIPPGLRRLLQMGGERESPKAPGLIFPKMGFPAPELRASVLIKEKFFNRSEHFTQKIKKEMQKISSLLCQTAHKNMERQSFFWSKSRAVSHILRESLRQGEKKALLPGKIFGSKYMSKRASFREHSVFSGRSSKERVQYTASFLKESHSGSRALKNLVKEAALDRKESRTRENSFFLKESIKETFAHPKERRPALSSAPGARTVNIGTLYIEGAQIRDFESFKRELSSAVEDL